MSGPPYPRPALPGSNAIGTFAIGVSPIGTISPFDPWSTVISQYANSPALCEMVLRFNEATDQTINMERFHDLVWNVATAQGYGLDVWGRILGVTRTLRFPGTISSFGFEEAGSWTGFGQGGFYGGGATTTNFVLSDDDFRTLIYAKAAGNISDGSILSLNQILRTLFPHRGSCYVVDGLDMTLTLTFAFALTQAELAIVQQSGVLPIPAGVAINISQASS